jgi:hypothetical protein
VQDDREDRGVNQNPQKLDHHRLHSKRNDNAPSPAPFRGMRGEG